MARDSIDDYKRKRDFGRTPEPEPGKLRERRESLEFVIHRHDASSLHYDLRLEMEGVLRSWAVPRGLSYDPTDKRLAVRTEDHPMEYVSFHGVIPKGQYGAGTMTICDAGTYVITSPDGPAGVVEGKLEFILYGKRFRGEWHLVRTKGEKGNEWLLFKAGDRFARAGTQELPGGDLAKAIRGEKPPRFTVMQPGAECEPFTDRDWIFEAAFDGARVLAEKNGDDVVLRSGRRRTLAKALPEVACDVARIRAERAVLDGVLVAMDETGRPDPARLERRLAGDASIVAQLYVFDLPFWEEWDLRPVPLLERKKQLRFILEDRGHLLFVDHVAARGESLAAAVARGGLGHVAARRADGRYVAGKSAAWRTVRVEDVDTGRAADVLEALGGGGPPEAPRVPGIRFTNLSKVFWPAEGFTKGDLVRYYDQVADYLLPYLANRPLHMRRMPDGIEGEAFYQRRAPDHVPDWVELIDVPSSEGRKERHVVCSDRRTLLYLANLGSIDLHPWMSSRADLDSPDWVVLDLDPKEAPFTDVVKIARVIGKILAAIGVTGVPKTSGKTGLHVFIPLAPGYTFDQGRIFCEAIARIVAKDHKSIATVERHPGNRGGRVYVDFMQNHRGQTVVPPYVARPFAAARVSAPLQWDEVDSDLDPDAFNIMTMPDRLARVGDLYRPVLELKQDLLPAITALQEYAAR